MSDEDPISREAMECAFRFEFPPGERRAVVRHLLGEHAPCRDLAREAGRRSGIWSPPAARGDRSSPAGPACGAQGKVVPAAGIVPAAGGERA